jgi:hypothetical protein
MRAIHGLMVASALIGIGYGKDRDWKTGKVLDSATARSYVTTGIIGTDGGSATVTTGAIDETAILIAGGEYLYTVSDHVQKAVGMPTQGIALRAIANHKHGCRLIINDQVKYAQEKTAMYVLDADGKECKMEIVRQERVEKPKP